MKPETQTGMWRHLCSNCQRDCIRLASDGPGSFMVTLCEVCDAQTVAVMWGDSTAEEIA